MLENIFKLNENKTSVKTEILAGVATFLTMAYIIVVNPAILSTEGTGMDFGGVFVATIIAAIVGCLVMGLWANWPIALAPGMGLNAFFAFGVVFGMGYTYQQALAAVFSDELMASINEEQSSYWRSLETKNIPSFESDIIPFSNLIKS